MKSLKRRTTRPGRLIRTGLATILALPATVLGQATGPEEGEVFELSPFEVSTSNDVGYLSTNSTSGTSLNTAIKDLPMALQVINQDFITDLGATDMDEALAYAAGVFTDDQAASNSIGATRSTGSDDRSISSAGSGDRFANVVYIRGLAVPFQNRMGFRYGGVVVTPNSAIALGGLLDSSNIERMEVVKGPNSLLYGVGVLTGIVNVIPEKPLSEPHYEFSVKGGSHDFFRTTADLTGPIFKEGQSFLPGSLNYRVAGAYEERGNWTDFREKQVEYYTVQLEHRWSDKTRIFLEYQNGNTRESGVDSQWIIDEVNRAYDTEFRNEWDEGFNWARHEGTIDSLRSIDPTSFSSSISTTVGEQSGFLLTDQAFAGGGKPEEFRISGPDTYDERDEWNFIADLEVYPLKGLTFNAGVFLSEQETDGLDLSLRSHAASNPLVFNRDTTQFDSQLNGIWNAGGVYGVQMQDVVEAAAGVNISPAEGEDPNWIFPALNDDIKLVEYFWQRDLVKSKSTQARLRGTYTIDSGWLFDTRANHTFLAGYSYLNDKVDFPDGGISNVNAWANPVIENIEGESPEDREARRAALLTDQRSNDGLYYRSIANFEPIYFDGRNDGVDGHNTVRAGDVYLNQDITQEGYYGVYQGKFFDDKVELIFGIRRDIYNAVQYTYKRVDVDDEVLESAAYDTVYSDVLNEISKRFGIPLGDVSDDSKLTPEQIDARESLLNQRTEDGQYVSTYYENTYESGNAGYGYFGANRAGPVDEFYGKVPLSEHEIFEEDVTVDTLTFGINFDITRDLTLYGLYSEGISPNTALRDGDGEIIPAESTRNKEIGLKFDLMDSRISGSVAIFEIQRDNAIWDVDWAPAASKWLDAQLEVNRSREWEIPTFDPTLPSNYYVREQYLADYLGSVIGVDPGKLKFQSIGDTISQTLLREDIPDEIAPTLRDKLILINSVKTQTVFPEEMIAGMNLTQQFGGNVSVNNIGFDPEGLDELFEVSLYNPDTGEITTTQVSSAAVLYHAFMTREIDKTKNSFLANNHPIRYRNFDGAQPQDNNSVDLSRAQGALVTFDETIRGAEFDVVLTVNENLQFVVSYSHIEREANDSFNFTPWRSISSGDEPFVPVFTMLHREYGWEQAGIQPVWVNYDAYSAVASGGGVVSRDAIESAIVEEVENPDQTIPVQDMASRNAQGQELIFIDREGNVINEANPAKSSDYDQVLNGVSLNFNPEDEAAVWGKFTFTEGFLDNLSLNLGVKYVGKSRTSVAFNSASPLNPLTVTPEVSDYFRFDAGMSYRWDWNNYDFRLSLNVYNLFNHTYDVTTTVLDIPNPITGETVTKRTEQYYAPISFRLGLTVSF